MIIGYKQVCEGKVQVLAEVLSPWCLLPGRGGREVEAGLHRPHPRGQVQQIRPSQGHAGQELWPVGPYQIYSPGGPGHDGLRRVVDGGVGQQHQVPAAARRRYEAGLRPAGQTEKLINCTYNCQRRNVVLLKYCNFMCMIYSKIPFRFSCKVRMAPSTDNIDELFDLRNVFFTGNFQTCINEAQKLKVNITK